MAIACSRATLWLMLTRTVFACICAVFALVAPARAAVLDPSFGTGGRVVVDFGETTNVAAGDLALQPDGRIVAAGWVAGRFGVVRLLTDGRLDPSFGTGGIVRTSFGSQMRDAVQPRLTLQPDGAIVVAGPAIGPLSPNGVVPGYDFGVMRLLPDGRLDPSFGQGGLATFPIGEATDVTEDVAMQPDGKIVLAGYSTSRDAMNVNSDFAALRLTQTGQLDTGFGTGGAVTIPMDPDSGMESASAVEVLPDGHIVLAGVVARSETGFDLAAVRLTTAGALDWRTEFALGTGAWQEVVRSLAVQPDGSFYIGGSALAPGFGPSQVALTHFSATGVADRQVIRALGSIEDTSSGIAVDGSSVYLAVDSRSSSTQRTAGVLDVDGNPFMVAFPLGGFDQAAALARRADGALIELATVGSPYNARTWFGAAAVLPHEGPQSQPPPPPPPAPTVTATFPRLGAVMRRVRVFRGTATGVRFVEVALVRRAGQVCRYLKSPAPAFQVRRLHRRGSQCTQFIWKRATGATNWSYLLKRPLPKGQYRLYFRAYGVEPQRVVFTVR